MKKTHRKSASYSGAVLLRCCQRHLRQIVQLRKDGTADISWYSDHETDTEYRFTTAEQLAGMANPYQ